MSRSRTLLAVFVLVSLLGGAGAAGAQDDPPAAPDAVLGSGFTYDGMLQLGGQPISATCAFQFSLHDTPTLGAQVGNAQAVTDVSVVAGHFTVLLNGAGEFGPSAFDGSARWLAVAVKCPPNSNFTLLDPRQALTAVPYALYAAAGNFWSLDGNGGTNSANKIGTTDNMTLTLAVSGTAVLRLAPDAASPNIIGGYSGNTITGGAHGVVIAGGGSLGNLNTASANYATVGGGRGNIASSSDATVNGGFANIASGIRSTVGGGYLGIASGNGATVGGGGYNGSNADGNEARADASTIGGGYGNVILTAGSYATVGGGESNTASGTDSTVSGGFDNTASGHSATVAGGNRNVASGNVSFAAGYFARALHDGAFVWSDHIPFTPISSTVANQFLVRATGGISLTTNAAGTVGCKLSAGGGTWNCTSDRNAKANFAPVDGQGVLNLLVGIPIETWNYKTQDAAIRHIGPMAQDFNAAFGVGENDTQISTVDAQGVALAAIQGLYTVVQQKDAQITALQAEQANMNARLAALEQGRAPVATGNTLQPLMVLVLGLLAGGGLVTGAFALGRAKRTKAI